MIESIKNKFKVHSCIQNIMELYHMFYTKWMGVGGLWFLQE